MSQADYLTRRCEALGITWREVVRRCHAAGCLKAERTIYEYFQGGTVPREMLATLATALELKSMEERRDIAVALGFGDLVDFITDEAAA